MFFGEIFFLIKF